MSMLLIKQADEFVFHKESCNYAQINIPINTLNTAVNSNGETITLFQCDIGLRCIEVNDYHSATADDADKTNFYLQNIINLRYVE